MDALRALMIKDWPSGIGIGVDIAVLGGMIVLLVIIGARLYPRVVV